MSDNQTDGVTIEDIDSLSDRTVRELQQIAREYGIKPKGLKKKELVENIRKVLTQEEKELSKPDKAKEQQDGTQHTQPYDTPEKNNSNDNRRRSNRSGSDNKRKRKRRRAFTIFFLNQMRIPCTNAWQRLSPTSAPTLFRKARLKFYLTATVFFDP